MASLTEQIRLLRDQTGAGMVDCKNAITEANGDMDQAVDILRKKGAALAAKKAGRVAAEGLLGFAMTPNGDAAALVEVNSETDFVAKNEFFVRFTDALAKQVAESKIATTEDLSALVVDGLSVSQHAQDLTAKIGEKISVRRFVRIAKQSPADTIVTYMHPGNKIGVLVHAVGGKNSAAEQTLLRDIAMHIAAMSPHYLSIDQIPASRLAQEKEIFAAQMAEEKKPAQILEKILEGKLAKFKKENNLLDQIFVKDPEGKKTIADVLKSQNPDLRIAQFVRLQVGEGIEKKTENFAEEVARQVAESTK